jgi:cystathionine beta-lyase/cystathionine gamma-synthase
MTLEARRNASITEKTIRVSVGIEDPEDLVADMRQALDGCRG